MKQEWIEDFLALAEFGTFSRAALERNVTQPAFSRRIRLLEEWLGATLVDRGRQPVQLTAVAQRHVPEFRALLHDLAQLRMRMQEESRGSVHLIVSTQHSLTITHLPALLRLIGQESERHIEFEVLSENRDECVASFMRGRADLLLCLEEEDDPLLSIMPKTPRLQLGIEKIVPVTAPDMQNQHKSGLEDQKRLRVLSFPADSYMGRIMSAPMSRIMRTYNVEVVHESVFLAGVKEMVKAGLGMAWLPWSLAASDVREGKLVDLSSEFPVLNMRFSIYCHSQGQHQDVIRDIYALLKKSWTGAVLQEGMAPPYGGEDAPDFRQE
ncbi:LysR family transcriptional regulator [Paracandidimonas soli]|uniref:DNA-binding transcriptional LysR family regulator n=1 Tax=Paracandidimonas soli TaxID=1917182 RepID=A0A4R3V5A2_9BURK|nr:LysR family transcriptional regulator [Paracandidimonas soli]TCU98980.1 DNA-binding transcriptional LysR family regulator [Paracandidimonas soli]